MSERERVGMVVSPAEIDVFEFELDKGVAVCKGEYVVVPHPVQEGTYYLCRVFSGRAENPVFTPRGAGTGLASGGAVALGKRQESVVLRAEVLGYPIEDNNGRTRVMWPDFPPSPGDPVLRATRQDVEAFRLSQEGFLIDVLEDPYAKLDIPLDLNWLTKGHMAVFGQTRSGKSTFVLSLILKAEEQGEGCGVRPRFLIFDRYGEYGPVLERYPWAKVVDYRELLRPEDITEHAVVSMFGLPTRRKAGEVFAKKVIEYLRRGQGLPEPGLLAYEAAQLASRNRDRIEEEIMRALAEHKREYEKLKGLAEGGDRPSVDELVSEHPVVCVDFSTDMDIELQQSLLAALVRDGFALAVGHKGSRFSCVYVIEEAMFYAPEKGAPIYGNPADTRQALTAALSQAGGWNLGFLLISQRPAYVDKSVLSQCNTVVCFRMRMRADHEQVASVTGYPVRRIAELVSNLPDHRALLIGPANPMPFPVIVETKIVDYPRKATKSPVEVLREMSNRRVRVAEEPAARRARPEAEARERPTPVEREEGRNVELFYEVR